MHYSVQFFSSPLAVHSAVYSRLAKVRESREILESPTTTAKLAGDLSDPENHDPALAQRAYVSAAT